MIENDLMDVNMNEFVLISKWIALVLNKWKQ